MLFSDEKISLEVPEGEGVEEFDEEILHMRQMLKNQIDRSWNFRFVHSIAWKPLM